MARHPISSRVHRDAKDGPDDAFVSGVDRTVTWIKTHQRALTTAGVAIVLAVAGIAYYVTSQRTLESEAAARLTELQGTIASGNVQLAVRDLQGFVNRFGSTSAGDQGRLMLAEIYLRQGEPAQAIDVLGDLHEDVREPLGPAAARIAAAAREAMGEPDRAVALYLSIADGARFPFQAREALADAARVRFQNGDADAAADLYQRVLDTFEDGEQGRGYFEMWLAEARAQAEGGAAAAAAPSRQDTASGED